MDSYQPKTIPSLDDSKYFNILIYLNNKGRDLIYRNIKYLANRDQMSDDAKYRPWDYRLCDEIRTDCKTISSNRSNVAIYRLPPVYHDKWGIGHDGKSQYLIINKMRIDEWIKLNEEMPNPVLEDLSQGNLYMYGNYEKSDRHTELPPENEDFELALYNNTTGKECMKDIVCSLYKKGKLQDDSIYPHWNKDLLNKVRAELKKNPNMGGSITIHKMTKDLRDEWSIKQVRNREILHIKGNIVSAAPYALSQPGTSYSHRIYPGVHSHISNSSHFRYIFGQNPSMVHQESDLFSMGRRHHEDIKRNRIQTYDMVHTNSTSHTEPYEDYYRCDSPARYFAAQDEALQEESLRHMGINLAECGLDEESIADHEELNSPYSDDNDNENPGITECATVNSSDYISQFRPSFDHSPERFEDE